MYTCSPPDKRLGLRRHHSISATRCKKEPKDEPEVCFEQFKARPLDPRVLASAGDYGVPRVKSAPTTKAVAPKRVGRRSPSVLMCRLRSRAESREPRAAPEGARMVRRP